MRYIILAIVVIATCASWARPAAAQLCFKKYDDYFKKASHLYLPHAYKKSYKWMIAQASAESGCIPNTISSANAYGEFQLLPDTFKETVMIHKIHGSIFNAKTNITAGVAYMGDLLRKFISERTWYCRLENAQTSYHIGFGNWLKGQVSAGGAPCMGDIAQYLPDIIGDLNSKHNDIYLRNIRKYHFQYGRLY